MLSDEFLLSCNWNQILARIISAEGQIKADALFEEFSSVLSSDEVMLFHFRDGVGPDIIEHRTSNVSRRKQIGDYKNGFYLIDPFYLALERATQSGAISLRDVVDQDAFEQSEFFRHHYGKTGLVDELCYCMSDGHGGHLLLSFARSDQVGRYAGQEIALAKKLAPIVLAALGTSWKYVADPKAFAPPSADEIKLHQDLRRARNNFGRSILTEREFEVVQLMLRGYPIDLIADKLKMAEGTTKVHRRNIYRKFDIGSQAELFSLFIDVVFEAKLDSDEDPLLRYERPLHDNQ